MALLITLTFAVTTILYNIPNTGTIVASPYLRLYYDKDCTLEYLNNTNVDWGTLTIGSNIHHWWVKNTGNCNITLTLTILSFPSGWSLSWNYTGQILEPSQVLHILMQLQVPSGALKGAYTWTYRIGAEEAFL